MLSSSNHTAIKTLLDATPANQALYFVESTYTTAFPSVGGLINDTSVNIYQIVSEVQSNLYIRFCIHCIFLFSFLCIVFFFK